ncbi:hypothetical protein GCM10027592_31990 [Spirosoma flavus]
MALFHIPKKNRFPILLLEDELAIFDVLQRTAVACFPEAEFIPVTNFADAEAYLYNLAGKGPRLVIMDISLGGSHTGLDFLALLREHPLGKLVPAIVLSSREEQAIVKQAYHLGAASYFIKPFTLQDWKEFISNLRTYWYETVSLPLTYFEKLEDKQQKFRL